MAVYVSSVTRLGGEGHIEPLDTMALAWSNMKARMDRLEIPPGVSRRVDVATLRWPKGGEPAEGPADCAAELQVIPEPSANRHILPAGDYRLGLALTARDVDAKQYEIELHVDGEWHRQSHAVADHFTLSRLGD